MEKSQESERLQFIDKYVNALNENLPSSFSQWRLLKHYQKISDKEWEYTIEPNDAYVIKWLISPFIENIESATLVIGGLYITKVQPSDGGKIEFWEDCKLKPSDCFSNHPKVILHLKESSPESPPGLLYFFDERDLPSYDIPVKLKDQSWGPSTACSTYLEYKGVQCKDYNNILRVNTGLVGKLYRE